MQARQSLEDSLKALATAGGKKVRVALDEPHDEGVIRSLKAALPNRIYMQIPWTRAIEDYAERMGSACCAARTTSCSASGSVPQAIGLKRTEVRCSKNGQTPRWATASSTFCARPETARPRACI